MEPPAERAETAAAHQVSAVTDGTMRVVNPAAGSLRWPPGWVKAAVMITGIVGPVGAVAAFGAADRRGSRVPAAVRRASA